MKKALGYKKGKTYYNSYWKENHTIKDIKKDKHGEPVIVSEWEDGRITEHATPKQEGNYQV